MNEKETRVYRLSLHDLLLTSAPRWAVIEIEKKSDEPFNEEEIYELSKSLLEISLMNQKITGSKIGNPYTIVYNSKEEYEKENKNIVFNSLEECEKNIEKVLLESKREVEEKFSDFSFLNVLGLFGDEMLGNYMRYFLSTGTEKRRVAIRTPQV